MANGTAVQFRREPQQDKASPLMARRRQRGPTEQRKITLPVVMWDELERICRLQTKAYEKMGGKTAFSVSDLLESGAELYFRDVQDELGALPETPAEERQYIDRLAEVSRKLLRADMLGLAKTDN